MTDKPQVFGYRQLKGTWTTPYIFNILHALGWLCRDSLSKDIRRRKGRDVIHSRSASHYQLSGFPGKRCRQLQLFQRSCRLNSFLLQASPIRLTSYSCLFTRCLGTTSKTSQQLLVTQPSSQLQNTPCRTCRWSERENIFSNMRKEFLTLSKIELNRNYFFPSLSKIIYEQAKKKNEENIGLRQ